MIERITGIVIDLVRHSDRHNIVTLYTRTRGRVSFLCPAGTGKTARIRNARLMPLSVVVSDVTFKASRELQFLGPLIPGAIWHDLYFNPVKSTLVMFLSEFLNAFLRQSQPDEALWDYIYRSLESLDAARGPVSNRHLAFLTGLLPHAGIQPDLEGMEEGRRQWFDMRDGCLSDSIPPHNDMLPPEDVAYLPLLSRITARNCRYFRMRVDQRRHFLDELLHYYSVHYPGLSNLKSPSILAELR